MNTTSWTTRVMLALGVWPAMVGQAALPEWQAAVTAGTAPASRYFKDVDGPAPSGLYPVSWDVGALTGDRSFEFVVFAGQAGGSSALMGVAGQQALKFEQWQDTGNLGITDYGVADHSAPVVSPFYAETHLVFAHDGADTHLYVNGVLAHTFAGVVLQGTGLQWLGAVSSDGQFFGDVLDGRILGFASYDVALPGTEVAAHYEAWRQGVVPYSLSAWQSAVATGEAPVVTRFVPVSGLAPEVIGLPASAPRTLEFVVHAGQGGASSALAGRGGVGGRGLKFEQWNNTGVLGVTEFGVVDINSDFPTPFDQLAHIAFVTGENASQLYVNGEPRHTFDGVPLVFPDAVGLAAVATITETPAGTTFRDPLDGSVLRFASYDEFLPPSEITTHYSAFVADGGAGAFTAWQSAVATGLPAAATRFEPAAAADQVTLDVGALTGARTLEFIVNAGDGTASGSLLGDGIQSLRFEQWNNTGALGLTVYGVADHVTSAIPPVFTDTHIVFASDGTDTQLYLDGQLSWTFPGLPLTAAGLQGLATSAVISPGGVTTSYFDRLDGHVLGFAAYANELSPVELRQHADALLVPATAPVLRLTDFSRDPNTGNLTLTWTSTPGRLYDIVYSTTLGAFDQSAAVGVPAWAGLTTSHTIPNPQPAAPQLFFKVRQK